MSPAPAVTVVDCKLCGRPTKAPDGMCDRHAPRPRSARPYSFEFRANDPTTAKRYLLSGIPPSLWIAVRAQAKRKGLSVRQVILQLLRDWVER